MMTTTPPPHVYVYCRGWQRERGIAIQPITAEKARARFEHGGDDDWFSVAAYDPDDAREDSVPVYVLEVTPHAEVIRTKFYTPGRNLHLEYIFKQRDGRMFFEEAIRWIYNDDTRPHMLGDAERIVTTSFQPDGIVHEETYYPATQWVEPSMYVGVPVSGHWLDIPQFGDWEPFGNRNQG